MLEDKRNKNHRFSTKVRYESTFDNYHLNQYMYTEELIEEGIVTESQNGIAIVSVVQSDSCTECSAKIFCHTENNVRNVTAKDPYGVKAGDKVQISIKGRNVVFASLLLYGFPLIILLAGIFIGTMIFENNPELLSTLSGIAMVGIYFLFVYLVFQSKWGKKRFLPQIVLLTAKENKQTDDL